MEPLRREYWEKHLDLRVLTRYCGKLHSNGCNLHSLPNITGTWDPQITEKKMGTTSGMRKKDIDKWIILK
jgi:hypothetical protein